MRLERFISSLKSFLVQVAASVFAGALVARFGLPEAEVNLSSLALGVAVIPVFLLLGGIAATVLLLYGVVFVIDKALHALDLFDGLDGLS